MSTYAMKLMAAMVVSGLSVGMMNGAAQACSVNIEVTGETTVPAGAEPLALGAKTSDCKKTTFQWNVRGVGSLDEPTEQTLFYTPPSTIEGNKKQAIISVTVTEADGNEARDSVTVTIVGGGEIPPTPTPEPTPTQASCLKNKAAANNTNCDTCKWWSRIATYTREWEKSGKKIGRAAEPCECVEEISTKGVRVMYRINEDGSATFLPEGSILFGVFVDAKVPSEYWGTADGRHLSKIRRGTSCSEP